MKMAKEKPLSPPGSHVFLVLEPIRREEEEVFIFRTKTKHKDE